MEKFYLFSWRPRPPTLLSEEQLKELQTGYKKFQSQFEAQDKLSQTKASAELIEKRREQQSSWEQYRKAHTAAIEAHEAYLRSVRKAGDSDVVAREEEVELCIKEEVEVIDKL